MVIPDTLSIWLNEQAWPIGILLSFVVFVFVVLKISVARRRAVLSRERQGVTEQTFVEHLAQYDFDPVITGTTYRYLRDVQRIQFPILPSDDLDADLGLDTDDVNQTIRELLQSLNRVESPGVSQRPILTVEGLVRHLQASPRRKWNAAA
jgi:hypothetical protein